MASPFYGLKSCLGICTCDTCDCMSTAKMLLTFHTD